jgi:hypothetical protein
MVKSPSGPWGVSIRTPNKSIMKVVTQHDGESLKQCLERAKEMIRSIRIKYADRHDMVVELISRRKTFPKPKGLILKRNDLWCPYCVKPRQFKGNQLVQLDGISFISDYKRCVVCGISDNDYHVKTMNHLWPVMK